jgi:SNF2 family DNA or RNA helicase
MSKIIQLTNAEPGWVLVSFDFDWDIIEALRETPGRRYIDRGKKNLIPTGQIQNFKDLLKGWTFLDKTSINLDTKIHIYITNDSFYTIPKYQPMGKKDLRLTFLKRPRDGIELYRFLINEGKDVELHHQVEGHSLIMDPTVQLYDFQEDGVDFLRKNDYSGLLGLDMGLGKTIIACKAIEEIGRSPILITAPASLLAQWKSELSKHFGYDGAEIITAKLPKAKRLEAFNNADVIITNYEFLRLIPIERQFELLVLDECQRVKNWNTKTAKAIAKIPALRVIGLSGTPVENNIKELYNIIDAIRPAYFGTMRQFYQKHIVSEYGNKFVYKDLDGVYQKLKEVMFRVPLEVAEKYLPQYTIQEVQVPLSREELSFYRKMVRSYDYVVEAIAHAKTFACSSGMKMDLKVSSKEKELLNILDDLNERAVVNMFYDEEIKRLENIIEDKPIFFLSGRVKQSERGAIAEEFEETEDGVLLMTSVGTYGLNLQKTRVQINMDLEWTHARMKQRMGRIRRLEGSHDKILSIWMTSQDTIDKYLMDVIEYKRDLFDITIDGKAENKARRYITESMAKEFKMKAYG